MKIRAPKKMVSLTRKTHIPSWAVSPCCSRLAYWISGRRATLSGIMRAFLGDEAAAHRLVAIGRRRDDRRALEIVLGRRRRRAPFEAGCTPRVGTRFAAPKY